MSDRPVNVVLDTSAVLAYVQGSIDVGEIIVEVEAEQAAVALPVSCLIAAYLVASDRDRLRVLVNHPATVTLSVDPDDWEEVAILAESNGRADTAAAALIAVDHDATMLTRQPHVYGGMDVDFPIVAF